MKALSSFGAERKCKASSRRREGEQCSERYLLLPKLSGKIDLPARKIKGKKG